MGAGSALPPPMPAPFWPPVATTVGLLPMVMLLPSPRSPPSIPAPNWAPVAVTFAVPRMMTVPPVGLPAVPPIPAATSWSAVATTAALPSMVSVAAGWRLRRHHWMPVLRSTCRVRRRKCR